MASDEDLTIRRLDAATELDALRPLWLALRDHHHVVDPGRGSIRDDEGSWSRRRAFYAGWLEEAGAFCLVAERGDPGGTSGGLEVGGAEAVRPLVGYAMVAVVAAGPTWNAPERYACLETLSVAPGARGGGVGKALVDAVRANAAAAGLARLEVTAVAANADARRFYVREGFADAFITYGLTLDAR